MLREETTQYLFTLKDFLVGQLSKTLDPTIEVLIAEIDRELARRIEPTLH
jgi:hypothetical protein